MKSILMTLVLGFLVSAIGAKVTWDGEKPRIPHEDRVGCNDVYPVLVDGNITYVEVDCE